MAAPCTCPGGQHDGRFPYCSGTSGGPIVIERGGTDWAQIIDPRDARIAELEADTRQLRDILAQERQRFASEAVPARREQREWEYMRGERDRLRAKLERLAARGTDLRDCVDDSRAAAVAWDEEIRSKA